MRATIDLSAVQLAEVRRILARYARDCEVRAFGSRVTGSAERFSDLDLALLGDVPLAADQLEALRDAFSESDLPISVDVLDWRALSPEFREAIGDRFLVVQPAAIESTEEPKQ